MPPVPLQVTANAGKDDSAVGALLPDLNVGGVADITGAAQLDTSASASNVGSLGNNAISNAGLGQTVTGLVAKEIDVASDASLTAQGFSNLDASASSTGGVASADAGNADSMVTGLAEGLTLDIGGVGTLAATAQGTADASASSVTGATDASALQSSVGIASNLDMDTASMPWSAPPPPSSVVRMRPVRAEQARMPT